MAGEARTCTNCGKQQTTGAFCERCGTRLPEPPPVQPAVAPAAPAPAGEAATQQGTVPPNQAAAQPQHTAPQFPGPFSKLFDLSFQGFVTRGSLRVIFTSTLVLLGAYWLFALIFGIVAAAKYQAVWCVGIFSSLAVVTLLIIWTRIMMELTMTVSEMREEVQQAAAQAAQAAQAAEAAKAAPKTSARTTTRGTPAKTKK